MLIVAALGWTLVAVLVWWNRVAQKNYLRRLASKNRFIESLLPKRDRNGKYVTRKAL